MRKHMKKRGAVDFTKPGWSIRNLESERFYRDQAIALRDELGRKNNWRPPFWQGIVLISLGYALAKLIK